MVKTILFYIILQISACSVAQKNNQNDQVDQNSSRVTVGAEQTELYFPMISGKKIGVVANQTSMINGVHLVDSLVGAHFDVVRVFGPEHGFRGSAGAGETIADDKDKKTGLPVVSLYGKTKKPEDKDLQGLDIIIFDIQDVGVRFYTYISTLSLVMEACAENQVKLIVLDRPNPNGNYVDGPVLEKKFSSFVGMHEIPVVHGMTIGEYALMVNGEKWLKDGVVCDLTVIPVKNYNHHTPYILPVPPSPNLPNQNSVLLYPSLCFFEGTIISVARGTDFPFQAIGHPGYTPGNFTFTPRSISGVASNPPYEGISCFGKNFNGLDKVMDAEGPRLHLENLIVFYNFFKDKEEFFTPYFEKLAGTATLRQEIEAGWTEEQIRESWQKGLTHYKEIREKYLLYDE